MKQLLIALVILFVLSNPARAVSEDSGMYLVVGGGSSSTTNLVEATGTTVATGISFGGYLGYQFNERFSIETGYTSLYAGSAVTSYGSNIGTTAISGAEIDAIICFPIENGFSPFLRIGGASITEADNTPSATTTLLSGPSYGIGAKFKVNDHFAVRFGYNAYSLRDNASNTMPLTTAYAALVFKIN